MSRSRTPHLMPMRRWLPSLRICPSPSVLTNSASCVSGIRSPLGALTVSALSVASESDVDARSEEHTSELQSQSNLVCRLLLEKKKPSHGCSRGYRSLQQITTLKGTKRHPSLSVLDMDPTNPAHPHLSSDGRANLNSESMIHGH